MSKPLATAWVCQTSWRKLQRACAKSKQNYDAARRPLHHFIIVLQRQARLVAIVLAQAAMYLKCLAQARWARHSLHSYTIMLQGLARFVAFLLVQAAMCL
eukprot:1157975-Pelagomonas_calceolata.AAC.3